MKNRGKILEADLRKSLEKLLTGMNIVYYRCPDARQCMGRIKRQPGDFFMFHKGKTYILEAKEVKHDFRLPKKRVTQLPKMRLFAIAGVIPVVIVKHTTIDIYRYMSFDFMTTNFDSSEASYNLKNLPQYHSPEEIIRQVVLCL